MATDTAPQTVRVYRLKVVLRDISPQIWRRVLVSSDTTIADLHAIVQAVMGWEDLHLHQFRIHGKSYGVYRGGGLTFADNPRHVRLSDFRLHQGERFLYEYDFGDGWQHDIRLEQVLPLDEPAHYPVCIAEHGDCPPEDCGGPSGYAALLLERGSWRSWAKCTRRWPSSRSACATGSRADRGRRETTRRSATRWSG